VEDIKDVKQRKYNSLCSRIKVS